MPFSRRKRPQTCPKNLFRCPEFFFFFSPLGDPPWGGRSPFQIRFPTTPLFPPMGPPGGPPLGKRANRPALRPHLPKVGRGGTKSAPSIQRANRSPPRNGPRARPSRFFLFFFFVPKTGRPRPGFGGGPTTAVKRKMFLMLFYFIFPPLIRICPPVGPLKKPGCWGFPATKPPNHHGFSQGFPPPSLSGSAPAFFFVLFPNALCLAANPVPPQSQHEITFPSFFPPPPPLFFPVPWPPVLPKTPRAFPQSHVGRAPKNNSFGGPN